MTDDSRYTRADGLLDIDAVRADHKPDKGGVGPDWCRVCGGDYPCSFAWAAEMVEGFRARPRRTPVPDGAGEQKEEPC